MVDEGPVLKRFMARAKGRGTRILKRTSHITVVVGSGKKAKDEEMGHKVHPTGIRLGISKDWNSKWFANKRNSASIWPRTSRSARCSARNSPRRASPRS